MYEELVAKRNPFCACEDAASENVEGKPTNLRRRISDDTSICKELVVKNIKKKLLFFFGGLLSLDFFFVNTLFAVVTAREKPKKKKKNTAKEKRVLFNPFVKKKQNK